MGIIQNQRINLSYIYILTIAFFICLQSLQGQQFKNFPEHWKFTSEISADSAFKVINEANKKAILKEDTAGIISSLIALSAVSRALPDYSLAFDYAGEALFLAEAYSNPYLNALANEELGALHYLFVQNDLAGINFKQANKLFKEAHKRGLISKEDLFYAYFNLVLYSNRINNFEKGYAYIDSCEQMVNIHDSEKLYSVYLDEKRAILNSRQGNHKIALSYLETAEKRILQVPKTSKYYHKHHSFLIVVYASQATNHRKLGNLEIAKNFYEKSLAITDVYKEHTFYLSYVNEEYAQVLKSTGNPAKAYNHLLKAKQINDEYLNPRKATAQGFVQVKNRYTEALEQRNKEIGVQKLELSQQKEKILRFRILIIALLLLLVIVVFVVRSRFLNIKHQKEKALADKQQQHSEELLDHKNKELTANMLQLIEKEEIIKTLSEKLKESQADHSTKTLLSSIDKQSNQMWEAFNSRFMEQNKDFYKRLQQKVPDLSAADLKVCALIKLNFTGKEMANLLGISLGSVHVARHRLRKKMNIERDKNLTQFINSI